MKSLLPIGLLAAALAVLAGLQYRWVGEISRAERQRLENRLRDSAERFSRDFAEEFTRMALMFEPRTAPAEVPMVLAERYREFQQTAAFPGLVRNMYLVALPPEQPLEFRRFDPLTGELTPVPSLPPLTFPDFLAVSRGLVLEIDPDVLAGELLPALSARHFGGNDEVNYRITVVGAEGQNVLFSSAGLWTAAELASPDYSVDLLPWVAVQARTGDFRPGRGPGPGAGPGLRVDEPGRGGARGRGGPGPRRGGPILRGFEPPAAFRDLPGLPLRLLVQHEEGSLEAAVAQARRRNLAVSFGILLVLAAAGTAVLASSARARALGKMQVEFAAGVSHELRTPLAVIQSAAHNLKQGVVRNPDEIAEYAGLVQNEARRLSDMVEQVMAYAETQSGKKRYDITAVDVRDVLDQAIRNTPPPAGVASTIKQDIQENLPLAFADPTALLQCVQNLLSNAMKYGRRNDAIHVVIQAAPGLAGKIRISVMDEGPGVPAEEARHLFEPFHRGGKTGGIPGNGLGLHLVQKAIEAQGGSVAYSARPEGGASFTLTIPAAPARS